MNKKNSMEKPANTNLDIQALIKRRYSPRTFADKAVEADKLERIFEAVRWAPSSMNDQPWHLIVGTKEEQKNYDRIFDSLVEFNQIWAKLAPVLVVIVADTLSAKTKKRNTAFAYDCGQAAAYFSLQAMEEGLFTHQMGGFSKEKITEAFDIPERFEPVSIIALGYKGKIEDLPENFREMEKAERERRPQSAFVFTSDWGAK
jgi:nitroreductase